MHRQLLVAAALVVAAIAAGCVSPDDAVEAASLDARLASAAPGARLLEGGAGLLWEGRELVAPEPNDEQELRGFMLGYDRVSCADEARCERVPFTLSQPVARGTVAIDWDERDEDYHTAGEYLGAARLHLDLWVEDASGAVVAEGIESGHYASVAVIDGLAAGDYEAVVVAVWGRGAYAGAVHAQDAAPEGDAPVRELLPDVVMLPPTQLRIEHPLAREASPAMLAAGVRGCGPDEAAEAHVTRCLRFAGHVGNVGEGTFEMHLSHEQALASVPGKGEWAQRVFSSDGSFRDELVAEAEYHAVHGHFHLLRMAETTVHAYDLETGTRGEALGDGRKTGFCFIDGGLVDLAAPGPVPPEFFGAGCCYLVAFCQLDMLAYEDFFMGISPGWYDTYPWWRADQYVDVSQVPDGVYELVTVADPDGALVELDRSNNEASVVFRLTGDEVEILGPPASRA